MEKKAAIQYLLSEEGRKQNLLNSGDGKMLQVLESDIDEVIIRLAKVDDDGNVILNIGHRFIGSSIYNIILDYTINDYGCISSKCDMVYFDKTMTVEELVLWEETRLTNLECKHDELQVKAEEIINKNKIEEELKELKRIEETKAIAVKKQFEDEKRKLLVEKKNQEQKRYDNEKSHWIKLHGSEHLKDAFELGYNINKTYVIERAKQEFPDYIVDYYDKAGWDSRRNPSIEALNEVKELIKKEYCADVVWLTDPLDISEYGRHYFEESEAIVIENYLGSYDLIKTL
jgi:hypothetical protein